MQFLSKSKPHFRKNEHNDSEITMEPQESLEAKVIIRKENGTTIIILSDVRVQNQHNQNDITLALRQT